MSRTPEASTAPSTTLGPVPGLDLTAADPNVRPQDDFFQAWNGHWLDTFEIPADKAEYASFTALHDAAQEQLRVIIDELATPAATGSASGEPAVRTDATDDLDPTDTAAKIATIYLDFMDSDALRAGGTAPLAGLLSQIDALQTPAELPAAFGTLDRLGIGSPLGTCVHQDNHDSTRYLLDIQQSGLSLPDRDYYLDDKHASTLEALRSHIAKMWSLASFDAGDPAVGSAAADQIIALETKLAEIQWDSVRNRDPHETYNLLSLSELDELTEQFDAAAFISAVGAADRLTDLNVGQPDYVSGLSKLAFTVPIADWRLLLRWRALAMTASLLSPELDAANFAFFGTALRGVPEQRPRWQRGVELVQSAMPEALGKIYVARHFPPENKIRMVRLVENLLAAFGDSIDELEWMTATTKVKAHAKLATFRAKIGYPDTWRDYSGLDIVPGELVGNIQRARAFEHDRDIAKLGGPIDRDEWFMPPQMVNAYYNPEMNEIVFPAAILQPPFFDNDADDAINYGAIGAVIGHEISHGFDDKGSQYDGDGNLVNWWTDDDRGAFAERTEALVAQYAAYEPVPGHPLNGELTLGENIADISGLAVALRAYRRSLGCEPAPVIGGFTGEQRLFASFAQVWRTKTRDEETIRRVAIDPHSPPHFRVIGTLVNSDDFVSAFNVAAGDEMWRDADQRVRIW